MTSQSSSYLRPCAMQCPAREPLLSRAGYGSSHPAKVQYLPGRTRRAVRQLSNNTAEAVTDPWANKSERHWTNTVCKQCEFDSLSSSDRTLFFAVVYWAVRYSICCGDKEPQSGKMGSEMKTWRQILCLWCLWDEDISCVCVKRLTAGVLLAKVLRSLRLVLMNRRVLLMCRLTLWLAAWAMSTPRLKDRRGALGHRHAHKHNTVTSFHQQRGAQP